MGTVFAIWFFASIVALVNGLKNRDFKPIFLIFLYAGAATLCGGLIMQYGNEALQKKFTELIPYIGLSNFC